MINGSSDVRTVVEELGFGIDQTSDISFVVKLGVKDHPLLAIITVLDGELSIDCKLATLGEIGEDRISEFCLAALDLNSRIRPYAFALISDSDDPSLGDPSEWPVVLTNSVPIGDLSTGELEKALRSLISAALASRDLLKLFVNQFSQVSA